MQFFFEYFLYCTMYALKFSMNASHSRNLEKWIKIFFIPPKHSTLKSVHETRRKLSAGISFNVSRLTRTANRVTDFPGVNFAWNKGQVKKRSLPLYLLVTQSALTLLSTQGANSPNEAALMELRPEIARPFFRERVRRRIESSSLPSRIQRVFTRR